MKEYRMNSALWLATGVLALVAVAGGVSKTLIPKEKLDAHPESWTGHASGGFVKALGVLELAAAIGFVLPAVVDIAPIMVPVTAVCWAMLMAGAVTVHQRLGQTKLSAVTSCYFLLALFVAWGRLGPESFVG
jgi:hypothetical protein